MGPAAALKKAYAPGPGLDRNPISKPKEAMRLAPRLQPWAYTAPHPASPASPDRANLQGPQISTFCGAQVSGTSLSTHCVGSVPSTGPTRRDKVDMAESVMSPSSSSRPTALTSTQALTADCLGYNLELPTLSCAILSRFFTSLSLRCLMCKMEAS